jgi:ubiquinone/menaquinone biosynthesis C-methylase UbiE
MRTAYFSGGNAMEWCRDHLRATEDSALGNDPVATLVAYDLQAGSYIALAKAAPEANVRWCAQLARLLDGVVEEGDSLLEIGVGEATTLAGVLRKIAGVPRVALGCDLSWSRVDAGNRWLAENHCHASLFVADLFSVPLADGSIDVVYSSHSLEPNRGREKEALQECLRVARKAVVLVEPIYELASAEAQARMKHHGYVENLRETVEQLGAEVSDYRLLDYSPNVLNPSGVLCIRKAGQGERGALPETEPPWQCPTTGAGLVAGDEFFFAPEVGLAYPVLRRVPMLRSEHAIVASKLC